MQDYKDFAAKNGVQLLDTGSCQFCGAQTSRGVHQCLEIFNLGFQSIDYSLKENHKFRFFIVDAHTLQHPEIHGRWNNHFHLSRLHLIIRYKVDWRYDLSPKLSDYLKTYKKNNPNERLLPPAIGKRGEITTTDILNIANDPGLCKQAILNWANAVYLAWGEHHTSVDKIAQGFLAFR